MRSYNICIILLSVVEGQNTQLLSVTKQTKNAKQDFPKKREPEKT
jgi:hypothetical protein